MLAPFRRNRHISRRSGQLRYLGFGHAPSYRSLVACLDCLLPKSAQEACAPLFVPATTPRAVRHLFRDREGIVPDRLLVAPDRKRNTFPSLYSPRPASLDCPVTIGGDVATTEIHAKVFGGIVLRHIEVAGFVETLFRFG